MPEAPVSLEELYDIRNRLIRDIQSRLRGDTAEFLKSLQAGEPDFNFIGLPEAANLPAVKWKMINLQKLIKSDPKKHAQQTSALVALLKQ